MVHHGQWRVECGARRHSVAYRPRSIVSTSFRTDRLECDANAVGEIGAETKSIAMSRAISERSSEFHSGLANHILAEMAAVRHRCSHKLEAHGIRSVHWVSGHGRARFSSSVSEPVASDAHGGFSLRPYLRREPSVDTVLTTSLNIDLDGNVYTGSSRNLEPAIAIVVSTVADSDSHGHARPMAWVAEWLISGTRTRRRVAPPRDSRTHLTTSEDATLTTVARAGVNSRTPSRARVMSKRVQSYSDMTVASLIDVKTLVFIPSVIDRAVRRARSSADIVRKIAWASAH